MTKKYRLPVNDEQPECKQGEKFAGGKHRHPACGANVQETSIVGAFLFDTIAKADYDNIVIAALGPDRH